MTLTLTVLRCPERVAPETRQIEGGELSIGRAPDNDWVLPDPERDLSKHHCVLAYRSGGWQILDLSANGTFLNRDREPVGRDQSRPLNDGDRLGLGPYEIEVRIAETPAFASRRGADPFTLDPFASRPGFEPDPLLARNEERDPFGQAEAPASISLPPDYDPLALDPAEVPMAGPTMADHSPHLDDALRPPRVVLPEDWDRDFAAASPATPPTATPLVARPLSAKTVLELQPGPVIPLPHTPQLRASGSLSTTCSRLAPRRRRFPIKPRLRPFRIAGRLRRFQIALRPRRWALICPLRSCAALGSKKCASMIPRLRWSDWGPPFVRSSRACDKRLSRAAPSRANSGSRAR